MSITTLKGWRSCRLGSLLLKIEAGKSPLTLDRPACDGEYGVLKVSAVSWGQFRAKENKAVRADFETKNIPFVQAGDLIISRANTTELVGAAVMPEQTYPRLLLSDKTLRLVPRDDLIWPRYLLYALRTPDVRRHIEAHATGTSDSMRNISQTNLCNAEISFPTLSAQKRIAAILDKADAIRRTRRESIRIANGLMSSMFREMFGDPVTNPKGWRVDRLSKVAAVNGGLQVTAARSILPIVVPYLRVANVHREVVDISIVKPMRVTHDELERTKLQAGDVLVVEGHGNPEEIGRAAVWTGEIQPCTHQNHLIRVRADQSLIIPQYLSAYLNSSAGKAQLQRMGKTTSGLNTISIKNVQSVLVLIPALERQRHYLSVASKYNVVAQRLAVARVDGDRFFESLFHRAFRGEL